MFMNDKKNTILALGNKDFNNSLFELKEYLDFNLEISDEFAKVSNFKKYQGIIIHEDALKNMNVKKAVKDATINKIIIYNTKKKDFNYDTEELFLPVSIDQINKVISDNIVKRKFKSNSSLKINDYVLDKNVRKLLKNKLFLELTEKEIELIELLYKKLFTKKKEILSTIWKYSDDADTHTVETHIYRLRKKIKEVFNDDLFIKNDKRGYTI